jgi:hypothetical protein
MFPISGGQIVVAKFAGTLNHSGGLTFRHDGKTVTLTRFVMNTDTKHLTAAVGGRSLPIFDVNLASLERASEPHGIVVATNVELTVTSNAATALNSGLGVTTFTGGQPFGVASLIIAVKS